MEVGLAVLHDIGGDGCVRREAALDGEEGRDVKKTTPMSRGSYM
jgi:hypothetical protein